MGSFLGSLYILILVSLAGLRTSLVNSIGQFATQIGNILRNPDPSTLICFLNIPSNNGGLLSKQRPPARL